MPTLTACPNCARQLKVPDDLLGRPVKCPGCGTEFTATAAGVAPPPPIAASSPSPYGEPRGVYGGEPGGPPGPLPPKATGLLAPGICTVIVGLLYLVFGGICLSTYSQIQAHPEEFKAELEKQIQQQPNMTQEDKDKFIKMFTEMGPSIYLGLAVAAFFNALVMLAGGIQMARGRRGLFPWLAAILGFVPVFPCCCGGSVVGIWSAIALARAGRT